MLAILRKGLLVATLRRVIDNIREWLSPIVHNAEVEAPGAIIPFPVRIVGALEQHVVLAFSQPDRHFHRLRRAIVDDGFQFGVTSKRTAFVSRPAAARLSSPRSRQLQPGGIRSAGVPQVSFFPIPLLR